MITLSSISECFGFFPFFAITDKVLQPFVYKFVWTVLSFSWVNTQEWNGWVKWQVYVWLLKKWSRISQPFYISISNIWGFSCFISLSSFGMVSPFSLRHSKWVCCDMYCGLIYIYLMNNGAKHILLGYFAFHIFMLIKCLFNSLAIFYWVVSLFIIEI